MSDQVLSFDEIRAELDTALGGQSQPDLQIPHSPWQAPHNAMGISNSGQLFVPGQSLPKQIPPSQYS